MIVRLMALTAVLLVTAAAIPATQAGNLTSAPSAAPRMSSPSFSPSLSPNLGPRAMPSGTPLNTDLDFRVPKGGASKKTQDRAKTDRPAVKQAQAPTKTLKKRFQDLEEGKSGDATKDYCRALLKACMSQPDPRNDLCNWYMEDCANPK